jgi:type VI secretion system ImpA family protein
MAFNNNLSLFFESISDNPPCGPSLRYSETYDKIKNARHEEDDRLAQGIWKSEVKKADWDMVDRLCRDTLQTKSKDLQIAAWLTEAWLHLEGMGGLTQGLELILELTKTYWDNIHPQIDQGSFDLRIVPYEWINTRLSEEIQFVKITMPAARTTLPYHLVDYNDANRHVISGKKDGELPTGKPSLSKITTSIEQTPAAFYQSIDENCKKALALIENIEELLHEKLVGDTPSFYRIKEKISIVQRFAQHILAERGEKMAALHTTPEAPTKEPTSKKKTPGPIDSRDQAYAMLGEIASYLEKIEPHSPTPYLIRRSITWGSMTLSEVFADATANGKDLSLILDILDVKKENQH